MINIIDIYVSERGEVKKDVLILAMCKENNSKTLSINIPPIISNKWIYLDFYKADGTKIETARQEVINRGSNYYVEYSMPNNILDVVGELKMEVVAKDADDLVWKSYTAKFIVQEAICATEEIEESQPDVLGDLQRQIDELAEGDKGSVEEHNVDANAHQDIRGLIDRVGESLSEVANSGDYNDLINKPTIPSIEGLASENYVDTKIADLVNAAPETLDTLGEVAQAIQENEDVITALNTVIGTKANKTDVDTLRSKVSTTESNIDRLQSEKANTSDLEVTKSSIPTQISQLNNDAGYITGFSETDPTVPNYVKNITQNNINKPLNQRFIFHLYIFSILIIYISLLLKENSILFLTNSLLTL